MFLDLLWRYCFGTQGARWNHKHDFDNKGAVNGTWLDVSSHDSEFGICILIINLQSPFDIL